ncbi:MAG: hypothetical protein GY718_11635 [Lentisphaerae bacterium]|nr:hypothetical protein [Lentisphaerota bacterium]
MKVEEDMNGFFISWDYPRGVLARPVFGVLCTAGLGLMIFALCTVLSGSSALRSSFTTTFLVIVISFFALFEVYCVIRQFRTYVCEKLRFSTDSVVWFEGNKTVDRLMIETNISKVQVNFLAYLFFKSKETSFTSKDIFTLCKGPSSVMLALGNDSEAHYVGKTLVPQEKEFLLAVLNDWKERQSAK